MRLQCSCCIAYVAVLMQWFKTGTSVAVEIVSEKSDDDVKATAELIVTQIQEGQFNTGQRNLSAMLSQRSSIPGIVSVHHRISQSSRSAMPYKVVSVVGSSPCVCVCLDSDGAVEDYLIIDNLDPKLDIQQWSQFKVRVAAFLERANPQMIVVGAKGIGTKWLVREMASLLIEMSHKDLDGACRWLELSRQIVMGDMKIPIALSELPVYTQMCKNCEHYKHAELWQAVSLGRQLQDPLSEVAAIYSETEVSQLNRVKLHRLQSMLSPEHMRFAYVYHTHSKPYRHDRASVAYGRYARALVDVTNRVGVDVNLAFRSRHKSHVLQFVAGLGPRTAKQLLNMAGKGGHFESRRALLELNVLYEWVGRHIFMNAAGFLRIIDKNETEPEVLDDTRIHPENYGLARFMAENALDWYEDVEDSTLCAKVMEPSNCLKLDDLDLDAYATTLQEDGRSDLRLTLYDIKDELQFPFRELRRPFEPSKEAARLYDELADEPAAGGPPPMASYTFGPWSASSSGTVDSLKISRSKRSKRNSSRKIPLRLAFPSGPPPYTFGRWSASSSGTLDFLKTSRSKRSARGRHRLTLADLK
jgi:hypothetical protein